MLPLKSCVWVLNGLKNMILFINCTLGMLEGILIIVKPD